MDFHPPGVEALHLSGHPHSFGHPGAGSPSFFRHPGTPSIDPGLEASYYGEFPKSAITPSTPHVPSPRRLPGFVLDDRSLPNRDVNDATIDDAYAAFVLYCNPTFPISTDTSELKKTFRKPPMSDGKGFSTWDLFVLIRKLDQKEIKTWTQLALDLGVEPPSAEKGQSTQKVQQYSVRLKRWMRAMHIDAFFEFLLGKPHSYYRQIPHTHEPSPENGRDGVPLEEDLAIRALDPSFRPKRGRRKTEDVDDEAGGTATPPPKRPHLDISVAFAGPNGFVHSHSAYPSSAIPMSAHPDDMDRFMHGHDPWAAASVAPGPMMPHHNRALTPQSAITGPAGAQLRWRNETPSTPHPLSAIPTTAHPPDSAFDEPQSAVTPSLKVRSRRRHGPAVSSAWPSNSASPNGKLRGRPPSNRSVRDGPFVTFPANPNTKEAPTIDLGRSPLTPTPVIERAHSEVAAQQPDQQRFRFPPDPIPTPSSATSPAPPISATQGRPERLSLQVPQHVGGPVRLITPTLLVNGEANPSPTHRSTPQAVPGAISQRSTPNLFDGPSADDEGGPSDRSPSAAAQQPQDEERKPRLPVLTAEDLKRALAADLLRADITGRKRLRGTEAKALAEALLRRLNIPDNKVGEEVHRIVCASWLGLSGQTGLTGSGMGTAGGGGSAKRIVARRFRVGRDGYDSPVDEEEEGGGGTSGEGDGVRETFDVSWRVCFGGLAGELCVKELALGVEGEGAKAEGRRDGGKEPVNAREWMEKYERLQETVRAKEEELLRLKEKVLEVVL